ncbi:GNAT family protein [Desulfobacterales bacterium HSG2]|nr:GNAT family protein [Desulfobacterales bacterium HSG2]
MSTGQKLNLDPDLTCLKSLSVDKAEHLCNVDYENEMAFVATIGEHENEQIVGSSCYFLNPTVNLAEVAYMIPAEWQGVGLGTLLQKRMAEYARIKGIRGFVADVLAENTKMKKLAQDNQWVTKETLMIPDIASFNCFIRQLLGIKE